jgi:hypothetical protein
LKKLGKGYSTVRKQTSGSRPVLRITESADGGKTESGKTNAGKTNAGKTKAKA